MKKALALALVATMALSGSSFGVDVVAPFVNDLGPSISFLDIATNQNTFFTFCALANLSGAVIPCQVFYRDAAGAVVNSVNGIDGDTFNMPAGSLVIQVANSDAAETGGIVPDASLNVQGGTVYNGSVTYQHSAGSDDILGEVRQWANWAGQIVMGVAPMSISG